MVSAIDGDGRDEGSSLVSAGSGGFEVALIRIACEKAARGTDSGDFWKIDNGVYNNKEESVMREREREETHHTGALLKKVSDFIFKF